MAKPNHLVAVHRAAPHRTVFRPALRCCEQAFDQALCHPPVVRGERQIDVDQRVGFREPLPGRSNTAKAVDDPLVLAQQVRMRLQVLFVRNSRRRRPELDHVQRIQRQPRQICQTFGRVDFPPPAFPNTATLFIWHALSTCPPTRPQGQNRRASTRSFRRLPAAMNLRSSPSSLLCLPSSRRPLWPGEVPLSRAVLLRAIRASASYGVVTFLPFQVAFSVLRNSRFGLDARLRMIGHGSTYLGSNRDSIVMIRPTQAGEQVKIDFRHPAGRVLPRTPAHLSLDRGILLHEERGNYRTENVKNM